MAMKYLAIVVFLSGCASATVDTAIEKNECNGLIGAGGLQWAICEGMIPPGYDSHCTTLALEGFPSRTEKKICERYMVLEGFWEPA